VLCFTFTSLGFEIFGRRVFQPCSILSRPTFFEQTFGAVARQPGIYNAFLAANDWALLIKDEKWQFNIAVFCSLLRLRG
jgi:uncharacterized membrane protein